MDFCGIVTVNPNMKNINLEVKLSVQGTWSKGYKTMLLPLANYSTFKKPIV